MTIPVVTDALGIDAMVGGLRGMNTAVSDVTCVDALSALADLEAAAAATKSALMVRLESERIAQRKADGLPQRRWSEGIAAEIGLAVRQSPHKAAQLLSVARRLVNDLPHTYAALAAGPLTEWRATVIARETAILDPADVAIADTNLCADRDALNGMGDKQIDAAAKAEVYRLDPRAVVDHNEKKLDDRRVWTKPVPGALVQLTALLPLKVGISAYATLMRDADAMVAAGDRRTKDNIMADLAGARMAGAETTDTMPVAVEVILPDTILNPTDSQYDSAVAQVGDQVMPAETARRLVLDALDATADVTLRRLYANPGSGALTAMESVARQYPGGLKHFLIRRDGGICRTPHCGAPIRHADHAIAHHLGGPTTAGNGNGRCVRCNQAKEAAGWSTSIADNRPGHRHTIEIQTPTRHKHQAQAPPVVGYGQLGINAADAGRRRPASGSGRPESRR